MYTTRMMRVVVFPAPGQVFIHRFWSRGALIILFCSLVVITLAGSSFGVGRATGAGNLAAHRLATAAVAIFPNTNVIFHQRGVFLYFRVSRITKEVSQLNANGSWTTWHDGNFVAFKNS